MRCYGNVRGAIYPCDQVAATPNKRKCKECGRMFVPRKPLRRCDKEQVFCSDECARAYKARSQSRKYARTHNVKQGKTRYRCIETGVVYDGPTEAANASGTSAGNIVRACNSGCRAGGVHWERASGPLDVMRPRKTEFCKGVRCTSTGEVFDSARDAAEAAGVKVERIYKACYAGTRVDGREYEYMDEEK